MNNFEPSPFSKAIKTSSKILFLQQINDPVLGQPIVTADHPPPPIIVLVGPPGSGKANLLQTFCQNNKRHTIRGVSHTTREKTEEEIEDESYYFITSKQFQEMALKGEFLTVSQTLGRFFGLAQTEIAKTVGQSAALMLHMDLSGALTLRAKGLQCRLVLTMTSTAEEHKNQLVAKYYNQQENFKYLGAVEVENSPVKAKKLLSQHNIQPESSVTSMAKKIVNELLYSAVGRNTGSDEATEMRSYINLKDDEISIGSDRIFPASSRTSGILKVPSSKHKGFEPQVPRASVTFQEKEPMSHLHSPSHVQSCRSVTFSNVPKSSANLECGVHSVSGTLIRSEDCLLSVLSRAQMDCRSESYLDESPDSSKLWNVETEALKTVVDEIIDSRELYLNTHQTNPGLFMEVVFTDRPEEAHKKLKHLLKEAITSQPDSKPYYECRKDSVYKVVVATRLKSLHKEINSQLSISQKQLDFMQKPVTLKPLESKAEKSRKDVIDMMRRNHHQAFTYQLPKEVNYTRRRSSVGSVDDLYSNPKINHLGWTD